MASSPFQLRAFTTLIVTFSFLVLAATGLVLYIEPHGRVAYWTEWRLLGLGKEHWDGVHIVAALMFLLSSGVHVYLNRKPLKRFLLCRLRQGLGRTREMAVALVLVPLCTVGAAAGWQPFQAVLDLNEHIKSSWAATPASQPPFGHAELVSLESLCLKTGIEQEAALANLKRRGISFTSEQQLLRDVAHANSMTPHAVFRVMCGGARPARRKTGRGKGRKATAGPRAATTRGEAELGADSRQAVVRGFRMYSGRGLGKKTLEDVCKELGLRPQQGRDALLKAGIRASDDQTLKTIALGAGMRPRALLETLCKNGAC